MAAYADRICALRRTGRSPARRLRHDRPRDGAAQPMIRDLSQPAVCLAAVRDLCAGRAHRAQFRLRPGSPRLRVSSASAPIRQFRRSWRRSARSRRCRSGCPRPIVQPCSMAMWPMVQSSPMVSGKPGSVWSTQPSCTFERAPITIGSLSPRSTLPNQTLASSRRTSPCRSRSRCRPPSSDPLAGFSTRAPSSS